MAAVGAPEAQVGRLDVLQFGGERSVAGLNARRQAEVKQLRDARLATGGREGFRACVTMREDEVQYRHESTAQFQSRFGAGEARYDVTSRTVREPVSPEKKAVFNEAKRLIEQSTQVMSYLEVLASGDQNATFTALKAARPELTSVANVTALRNAALDTIASDPAFQKMFPELKGTSGSPVSDADRRNIIEDTLARDPRFQARLATRMEQIYESAQKLPELKTNPQLEADRQKAQGEYDVKIRQIVAELQKAGIATLPGSGAAVTEASVRALIDANAAAPNAPDAFAQAITGVDIPATLAQVAGNPSAQTAFMGGDFDAIRTQIPTLTNEQINALQNFRINLNTITVPGYVPDQTYIQDFVTRHAGNVTALDTNDLTRQILNDWNVSGGVNNFADQQQIAKAKAMARAMLPPSGTVATPLKDMARDASAAEIKLKDLDTRALSDKDMMQSERMRLIEETKLLNQLDAVLSNALADVMEDRYDQMIPLEEERLALKIKNAEEAKKTDLAKLIRQLGDTKARRWVEYNKTTRKREVHRGNISADMQDVVYASNQEEQIKSMLMRDSGYAITQYTDASGASQTIAPGMQVDLITGVVRNNTGAEVGKANLDTLNELYKSEKDSYTQKLFGSYFASRRFYDRSLNMIGGSVAFGDLGLKDHEWVLLEQQFGNQITESLMSDKQGRAAIDKLKNEGVISNFKLKWLLYLALMLGGGVVLGPIAGLALGGVAAATVGGGVGTVVGGGIAGSVAGAAGGAGAAHAVSERVH